MDLADWLTAIALGIYWLAVAPVFRLLLARRYAIGFGSRYFLKAYFVALVLFLTTVVCAKLLGYKFGIDQGGVGLLLLIFSPTGYALLLGMLFILLAETAWWMWRRQFRRRRRRQR